MAYSEVGCRRRGSRAQLVVEQLPLRYDITEALLHGIGSLGEMLAGAIAYQQGEFEEAEQLVAQGADVEGVYRESIAWADRSIAELR